MTYIPYYKYGDIARILESGILTAMLKSEGNHEFTAYVEDHGEPGSDAATPDRFWIEVRDKGDWVIYDLSIPLSADVEAVDIEGGNVVVPHTTEK